MTERLSRDEYLAHCLWRNPAFQAFMVRLWQELPPVLEKHEPSPSERGASRFTRASQPGESPTEPSLPEDVVVPAPSLPVDTFRPIDDSRCAVHCVSFDAFVRALNRVAFLQAFVVSEDDEEGYWSFVPFGTESYGKALGRPVSELKTKLEAFREEARQSWPRWVAGRLVDPHTRDWWTARPTLVTRSRRGGRLPEGGRLAGPGIFKAAKLWIPIYEDTSAESLNWPSIVTLQERLYGAKVRKQDPAYYAQLLAIYDKVNQGDSFGAIASLLHVPPSTVKSRWLVVQRDVTGFSDPEAARQLTREHTPAIHDTESCPTCRGATKAKELCPLAREYAHQDRRSRGRRRSPTR